MNYDQKSLIVIKKRKSCVVSYLKQQRGCWCGEVALILLWSAFVDVDGQ